MAGDTTPVARSAPRPADRRPGWPSSTSCGWRSRSPAPTCAVWPGCAARGARDPDRRRRDDADLRRGARRHRRRRVRRATSRTSSWPAGMLRTRTVARARPRAEPLVHAAHLDERARACWPTSTSRPASAAARSSRFPYDPPGWTPERRDAFLAEPIRPDADGVLRVPARPGLGRGPRRGRDRAVRRMSPTSDARPSARLDRAGGRGRAADRGVHRRRGSCPAASGRTFDDIAGRDGSVIAGRRRGRRRRTSTGRSPPPGARSTTAAGPTSRPPDRKRVLLRLAELIRANRDELALLESLDVGKPIRDTLAVDVPSCRQDDPVVRRDDRQGLRRGRADRARTRCRS